MLGLESARGGAPAPRHRRRCLRPCPPACTCARPAATQCGHPRSSACPAARAGRTGQDPPRRGNQHGSTLPQAPASPGSYRAPSSGSQNKPAETLAQAGIAVQQARRWGLEIGVIGAALVMLARLSRRLAEHR